MPRQVHPSILPSDWQTPVWAHCENDEEEEDEEGDEGVDDEGAVSGRPRAVTCSVLTFDVLC
eukprot:350178-Chlamydomonas_euryale.AAC.8